MNNNYSTYTEIQIRTKRHHSPRDTKTTGTPDASLVELLRIREVSVSYSKEQS